MKAIESFLEDTLLGQLISTACAVGVPLIMVILL